MTMPKAARHRLRMLSRRGKQRDDRAATLRTLRSLVAAQTGELATVRTLLEKQHMLLDQLYGAFVFVQVDLGVIRKAVTDRGPETVGVGDPAGDSGDDGDHGGG